MKKLFALMLALCLLCSFALAEDDGYDDEYDYGYNDEYEEDEVQELTWEDVTSEEIEAAGTFQQITVADTNLVYWIPVNMAAVDVNKIKAEVPPAAAFATIDGLYTISVFALNITSLQEYLTSLEAGGAEYFENLRVNGIDCVNCENEDADIQILIVPVNDTTVLVYNFSPIQGEDGWIELKDIVAASVRIAP